MTTTRTTDVRLDDPAELPLDPADVERFWRDGFLSIASITDAGGLAESRRAYDRLLRKEVDCGEDDRMLGGLTRQIMHPSNHDAAFADNAVRRGVEAIARDLLGTANVQLSYDMLIYKQPGNRNDTPWHQDWAYAEMPVAPAGIVMPNDRLQFWVALDDVTVETGCMQFVAGAHREGMREHYVHSGADDDVGHLLATRDVREGEAIACPLSAGGCTVHTTGTLHFTGGNHSADRIRRAYILNMIATPDDEVTG